MSVVAHGQDLAVVVSELVTDLRPTAYRARKRESG